MQWSSSSCKFSEAVTTSLSSINSIIALVKNEIRIVQAALIGSLLANLLLILGMAFLIGGLEFQEQIYDSTVTQMSAALLALAVLSLLIPVRICYDVLMIYLLT